MQELERTLSKALSELSFAPRVDFQYRFDCCEKETAMRQNLASFAGMFLLFIAVLVSAKGDAPFKAVSFEAACKQAKSTDKLVLIDFYTTWCGPCKLLDKNTWADAKVKAWLKTHTVCLKVDAEKSVALANKYHIDAYPTILLLTATGKEKDRIVGFVDPHEFLTTMKQSLAGKDSLARATLKLKAAGKNDPMAREAYGQTLARKGKYKEALAEYLWCFDEGAKADSAFSGVRLSFLLSSIVQLGKSYPDALNSLRVRRDKAETLLLTPNPNTETAWDYKSLNYYLDDVDRSLALYDKLKAKKSPIASELKVGVLELMLEKKRYLDIVSSDEEVNDAVEQGIASYKSSAAYEKDESDYPSMKPYYINQIAPYLQAYAGAGKEPETKSLMKKILALEKSPKTYASLLTRAKAIDSAFLKNLLLASAKENLTPAEYDSL